MIFAKYEFPKGIWDTLKSQINQNDQYSGCAVVELGDINSTGNYAVDIMWYNEIPSDFNQYEVFPNPVGIHTFAGCDDLYKQRFCQFNPQSPYCTVEG